MEFAEEGGEGPTPYEVLLQAAMEGNSALFTRQDSVEETWRIMRPLIEHPPPVHAYAPDTWGPKEADQLLGEHRRWHGPWVRVMSTTPRKPPARAASKKKPAPHSDGRAAMVAEPPPVRSAAAPSPFPPIADYAFLSDCHTGALVAPDGSIDWLCVPRFDAPSVFGTLLDREAGMFRLGPFGTTVPSGRYYEPGTNVLITTWKTHGGWIEVRDALTMGPTTCEDTVTPHTRPPADEDAEHMLVRTVTSLEGEVEIELICEPAFDYGRTPAQWQLVDGSRHLADATGAGQTIRLHTDLELGIEANRIRARHTLRPGERAYAALVWAEGLAGPADVEDADRRLDATVSFWRKWLGPSAPVRRPSLARRDPALGADDQGTHVHADGCDRRGAHHLAARDTRRGAQLGLPLHVDAGFDVHAAGAASARPRLGGRRVHAVRRRHRAERATAGCRSCTGSTAGAI